MKSCRLDFLSLGRPRLSVSVAHLAHMWNVVVQDRFTKRRAVFFFGLSVYMMWTAPFSIRINILFILKNTKKEYLGVNIQFFISICLDELIFIVFYLIFGRNQIALTKTK